MYKNVYNISSVFLCDGNVIVKKSIADKLREIANIKTKKLFLDFAYNFPYHAGDMSYKSDTRFVKAMSMTKEVDMRQLTIHFARLCGAVTHAIDYVELALPKMSSRKHGLEMFISDPTAGIRQRTLMVHPDDIERHGMVWNCGIFCSRRVADLLRPHLNTPFIGVIDNETD